MFFARLAYFSVLSVSSKDDSAEEMLAIITVRQLPPNESFSSRVSFESRYGTKLPLLPFSPKALMQLPSASSDRLMFAPAMATRHDSKEEREKEREMITPCAGGGCT